MSIRTMDSHPEDVKRIEHLARELYSGKPTSHIEYHFYSLQLAV
jgi:hypothetical protein